MTLQRTLFILALMLFAAHTNAQINDARGNEQPEPEPEFLGCIEMPATPDVAVISGIIRDASTGEPIPFTNVYFEWQGQVFGTASDFDGRYIIRGMKGIETSEVEVNATNVGYEPALTKGVVLRPGTETRLDVELSPAVIKYCICVITTCTELIDRDPGNTGKTTLTRNELRRMIR